jgi:hypothetical protein
MDDFGDDLDAYEDGEPRRSSWIPRAPSAYAVPSPGPMKYSLLSSASLYQAHRCLRCVKILHRDHDGPYCSSECMEAFMEYGKCVICSSPVTSTGWGHQGLCSRKCLYDPRCKAYCGCCSLCSARE